MLGFNELILLEERFWAGVNGRYQDDGSLEPVALEWLPQRQD